MLAVLNDRVRRTVSIRILGLASQQLCWEEGKKEIQMKRLNPNLSFLGSQFKCLHNQHIHKSLAAEGNSVNDFHRWRICWCVANLHGSESWIAQCSQKGPVCEVSKAWFPMERLLPRSLAVLFPSLPPVHAVFSAVDLATALGAQFGISWNPNLFWLFGQNADLWPSVWLTRCQKVRY